MENTEHSPSQVIDSPSPTTENPSITPDPPKQEEPKVEKLTAQQAIEKAMGPSKAEDGDEDAPVDPAKGKEETPKNVPAAKEAKEAAVAPEKSDADEQAGKTKRELRSESLRAPPPAPARFIPSARDRWGNVPQEVKFEVTRVLDEAEREIAQYREHKQFREELKDFEELAQRHNVPLKEALNNYVDIERKFSEDPATGFRQLFNNLGMSPTQAVGHILRAFNATPQQLAQHIQNAPHEYTALAQQRPQAPQPQQPQHNVPDPQIKQLEQRLAAMEAEKVANDIIRPFTEEYPEYYENEDAIAEVLKSGIIERIHGNGLSPRERLEVALGMVAPHALKRSSQFNGNVEQLTVPASRDTPAVDLRGTKSIKGAPHGVQTDRRGKMSKDDAINEAMARFGA